MEVDDDEAECRGFLPTGEHVDDAENHEFDDCGAGNAGIAIGTDEDDDDADNDDVSMTESDKQ